MKRTPLYHDHVRLGAKMVEFAGWEMPLYYSGIVQEVEAVRSGVGIFDVSHMGQVTISGPSALDLVQHLVTNDASRLDIGKAQYTLFCNEAGGVVDDLIVYRTGEQSYLLVINASNTDTDLAWMKAHNPYQSAEVVHHADRAMIALQGPSAQAALQPLVGSDLTPLRRMRGREDRVAEIEAWVARSGYTGEDGFEICCATDDAHELWSALLAGGEQQGIRPAGLAARDVLRVEVCYPLYGHEINVETSPVDAGLMWVVQSQKGEFLGRQAILEAEARGPEHRLVGIIAEERCIPRDGQIVLMNGSPIGRVTSGTFSPTLKAGIAMAYVRPDSAEPESLVQVDVRGKLCACRVVPTPFYRADKALATTTKQMETAQ